MFKIISDTACDFTDEQAKENDVQITPFYIIINGQYYIEGKDISREEFYGRMLKEKTFAPRTAQPNPEDYKNAFLPHLKEGRDILAVTISGQLSGSAASARLAAELCKEEYPERLIEVIDSESASAGQGLVLLEIIKMRNEGFTAARAATLARKVVKNTKIFFSVGTLEFLRRGGRIGAAKAAIGGILGVRPLLRLVDGKIAQLSAARGKLKAFSAMKEAVLEAVSGNGGFFARMGHILCEKDADSFRQEMETSLNKKICKPVEVCVTVGAHIGPGAIAFAVCEGFNSED